jgi:flagellar M-ring protein FliF
VNVVNTNFSTIETPEPLPEVPIWERPWVWDVGKQLVGLIFAGLVVFTVLRPVMRTMVKKDAPVTTAELTGPGRAALAGGTGAAATAEGTSGTVGADGSAAALADAQSGEGGTSGEPRRIGPPKDDNDIEAVKAYVKQEPKIAAQVVKAWLEAEG